MFPHIRGRVWLPVHKLIAAVVSLVVLAGVITLTVSLTDDGDPCGEGLTEKGSAEAKECIGVSEGDHVFDPGLKGVLRSIKKENDRVRHGWEDPKNGKPAIPYGRIAVMMPMTEDESSAMTAELIKNGLVGAHTAQLRANKGSGPHYQLLLANDGKDLNHWQPVVDQLASMTDDDAPLVAVMGLSSSTPDTQKAADALSEKEKRIPVVAPVITSEEMSAKYLFKTSASNEQFALALKRYLADRPSSGKGFLVRDLREQDAYASDLSDTFTEHFGKDYKLDGHDASYLGETGEDAGLPQRFSNAVTGICTTGADTVFFAGRDRDLGPLISEIAERACNGKKPIRIIKVGIGRNPVFTDKKTTKLMKKAHITTVGGSDVDPRWWESDTAESNTAEPDDFDDFHDEYKSLKQDLNLADEALDDGYTIMYHDAFTALVQAVGESFTAVNDDGDGDGKEMPTKDDVYNTMINMNGFGTEDGTDCRNCVRGASGTFGFDDNRTKDKWPVCKPVPIVEYPKPKEKKGDSESGQAYRTYEDTFDGCR